MCLSDFTVSMKILFLGFIFQLQALRNALHSIVGASEMGVSHPVGQQTMTEYMLEIR